MQNKLQYSSEAVWNFYVCYNTDVCLDYLDIVIGDSQLHIQASPYYSPDKILYFDEPESMLTYHVSLLLKKKSALETDIG